MALSCDNVATLADGRALGYAWCGDPTGTPVLTFHGTQGCRLELMRPEFDFLAARMGVRVLALDRPGMGLSDPKLGRTILDWPVDVVGFAEAMGLSRFSVLGLAGGSPYALACAVRIPHRLRSVGVVSGLAPTNVTAAQEGMSRPNRRLFFWARHLPWLARKAVANTGKRLVIGSEKLIEQSLETLAAPDRELMADPAIRSHVLSCLRAAFRRGIDGPFEDLVLVSRSWGFELSQVPMVVNLWFGGLDATVPPASGRYLANALRRSEARFYPDDGHTSLIWNRFEEVLLGLLATAEREAGRPV